MEQLGFGFDAEGHKTHILSYGGGVDSTALLAMHLNRDRAAEVLGISRGDLDTHLPFFEAVVFSDPGAEMPHTYETVRLAGRICADHGLRFETVRKEGDTILSWLERNGNLPLLPGAGHVCSLKFKAEILHRWADGGRVGYVEGLNGAGYVECVGSVSDLRAWADREYRGVKVWSIGIEVDETHRAFTSKTTDVHQCIHPLVALNMNRRDCIDMLRVIWSEPVKKSACFFCPFASLDEIRTLQKKHPGLWEEARKIEERFRRTSQAKYQAFIDGGQKVNSAGRALPGTWKKDSWAEGARLFAKTISGKRLSISEWDEFFDNEDTQAA